MLSEPVLQTLPHCPSPLEQGEELQRSIFFSQLKPEKPAGQWQV